MPRASKQERFPYGDLATRVPEHRHRIYLVQNPRQGLLIDDYDNGNVIRSSWGSDGYQGDDCRRNRWSIEVRARNGKVVAAVAWRLTRKKGTIKTIGTYVSEKLRCRGIGTSLWRAMLWHTDARTVISMPVTDEGLTLVRSMREKLGAAVKIKTIKWLEDPIRDLRKSA